MLEKSDIEKLKDIKIKRGYYNASILYLENFVYEKNTCSNCHEIKHSFILPRNREMDLLCTDCLGVIDMEFDHDTEKGIVTNDLDLPDFEDDYDVHKHVESDSIKKLLDTPGFNTIQGGPWFVHCRNFMEFQGVWEPKDFKEKTHATGKDLFLEMTEDNYNYLWDELELADNESELTWLDIEYYAFKCLKCNSYRGFWECD